MEEQFIDSCPKDLAIHLCERAPETLAKIAKITDQYLEAHGKHLFSPVSKKLAEEPEDEAENTQSNSTAIQCYNCNARGHKAVNWPARIKSCFLCGKQGHEARNCRSNGRRFGGQSKDGNPVLHGEVSASCLVQPSEVKPTKEEVNSCLKDDQLLLACSKKIPLLSNACVEPLYGVRSKMPVVKGRVGENSVDVLRDTDCSGIVVKKDFVSEDQFSDNFNVMLLIDNTAGKVPIIKIDVDTPYLKGHVEAQCLPDPIYDLVIGNVPGARAADDPDPSCQVHLQEVNTVTARSQAKMAGESIPLKILNTDESPVVDREKPRQMQCGEESLLKYVEWSDKLSEPLKQAMDQIQKLSEVLKQEQVHGAEREEPMKHLQGSLDDQQRKLSDVRDALNNWKKSYPSKSS